MIPPEETRFAVYLHWPFCAAKCPYCDFNSHVRHKPVDEAAFVEAFSRELARFGERTPGRTVTSIFFGGGTPSLMRPATVEGLLKAVAANWTVAANAEITLEANPSSVEAERFRGYRAAGVNRVSLGVQALDDASLRALGRLHNRAEALAAVELARQLFPRLSFDLIYARSGQTLKAWRTELTEALTFAADHLSLYQLTIESGTPFAALHRAGKLVVPGPDEGADFYELTQEMTARAGLPAYEISNHAEPGAESRHNLTYWRHGEFVGSGPGAHGRIVGEKGRVATATEPHPERWLERVAEKGEGLVEDGLLTLEEEADEMLVMGLRLTEGIELERYHALAGRPLQKRRIADLVEHGMVRLDPSGRLVATPDGLAVLDAVVADLAA
ncbi:radical SAM family heme chaperone HemW [Afifella sp. IM 167]|uniref:radical SAM family heme chaperone HemW n=1 Tax=Afifella sp. IM 167 TaxID=2033586 RepID=UPI001CCC9CDE|nr:radical SAM family heme chaperone HemW [Afifella sp. IM 167]MBZ8133631.1 coproporphyrinogen III oxidase [Afifella sp. IM 167]